MIDGRLAARSGPAARRSPGRGGARAARTPAHFLRRLAPASARPTRCSRRRAACARPARTSSSATSSRTGARDRAAAGRPGAAADAAGELSRHRAPGVRSRRGAAAPPRRSCWSTSWRTRNLDRAAIRRRAIAKRWQDIEELLDAGIDVWTTVNVQHLESLNDLVAQITGVRQRETMPDRIFDEADEVELIDLPPDDLIARLQAGKVYVPERSRRRSSASSASRI